VVARSVVETFIDDLNEIGEIDAGMLRMCAWCRHSTRASRKAS